MHDKKFLTFLHPCRGSTLVYDKAYNYYLQFAAWREKEVNFVCRLKDHVKKQVQEVLFKKKCSKEAFGVYRVGHIHLDYKENKERKKHFVCVWL